MSDRDSTISVVNPATEEIVDTTPKGTVEDVDTAVEAAWDTFEEWSETDAIDRGATLSAAADRIESEIDDLAVLLTKEQGKPVRESKLELQQFIRTLRYNAGLARDIRGEQTSLAHGETGIVVKEPYGVCGGITPWNFPISLFGNKIAPGLAAGNTMVIKPASTTPLTTIRVTELMESAGLPAGAINIVTGDGSTVGNAIVEHDDIKKVGFTGSTDAGRTVMRSAASTLKPVTLELGGSDPMIVCEDAEFDDAVRAASVGRFFNNGQACLAIKRLFVHESIAESFVDELESKVEGLALGNGLDDAMIGPLHADWLADEMDEFVDDAVSRGATVLTGGGRSEEHETGYFYEPTLLEDVSEEAKISNEECFGPVLPIYTFSDLDDAIERANDTIYGLGSSVWTRDISKGKRVAEELEAGYTWINARQIERNELPFGGLKQSGIGKEHSRQGLDAYLQTRSIVVGN
ncbi:aldehyde dehydrogenase family protein [Natrinema halophilum]|uniref:aldehyde dehydrogenase family protein n=1 Tax=Natrinema halophilum TaxID=1699371 RepID=UPI001F46589D|nr:aldehyde dehydrogenase family protein [Natrinema halophilum]UHQ96371.1 aldehyde dehydrogenase family protein [Natrinema halophilum]